MFPAITQLEDLNNVQVVRQLSDACYDTIEDKLYYIPQSMDWEFFNGTPIENAVFAGPTALARLLKLWPLKVTKEFNPVNSDLYVLGRRVDGRLTKTFGKTNVFYVTEKTVDELLMGFDLPCNRVAMDLQCNLWVSAQALNTILTREYYLPLYFNSRTSLTKLLRSYQWNEVALEKEKLSKDDAGLLEPEEILFDELQERIKKYTERGFVPYYINTSMITPWVKRNFYYVNWDQPIPTVAPVPPVVPPPPPPVSIAPVPPVATTSDIQVSPIVLDAFGKLIQSPNIRKLLVDLGFIVSNTAPVPTPVPVPPVSVQSEGIQVVPLSNRPGFYQSIFEGFIIKACTDGNAVVTAINVGNGERPLNDDEKRIASSLGLCITSENPPALVIPKYLSGNRDETRSIGVTDVLANVHTASTSTPIPVLPLGLKN